MEPRPLITLATLAQSIGGPARSVPALAHALHQRGVFTQLFTMDLQRDLGPSVSPTSESFTTHVVPGRYFPFARFVWSPRYRESLRRVCRETTVTLIHDNGLWMQPNHESSRASKALSIPLILSPRGMATKWALGYRGWKKALAMMLYQRSDLEAAFAFHATSPEEAQDLRRLGLQQPIAIIPNGIAAPEPSDVHPEGSVKTLLFLSRINPKKGLANLLEAWDLVRPKGWRVVVGGPSEEGYCEKLKTLVESRGLQREFSFIGPVDEKDKWKLFASADVFVLPTFSENFGLVIAEAMATGLPVITTKGAPWGVLHEQACGWWIDVGVEPLAEAIRAAIGLSDAERHHMGCIAKSIIKSRYSWGSVAAQMHEFYLWVLDPRREKPNCLV